MTDRIPGEALSSLPPGRYEIPVKGGSMFPCLRDRDVVVVRVPAGVPSMGDLLFVRHGDVGFVHRFVGRRGGRILTKGDAHPGLDGWNCTDADVLGRVEESFPAGGSPSRDYRKGRALAAARLSGLAGRLSGVQFALARRLDGLVGFQGESGPFRGAARLWNSVVFRGLALVSG